jgi:NAD(P)-dependent dehydrogenase (short-subunit alcohol dehydrogenase family)
MEGYALITGAAGGLGKAFAVECARRGYNLCLLTVVFPPRLVARVIHCRWRVTRKRLPLAKER